MQKSRQQIIDEMVIAATACYQHYADSALPKEVSQALAIVLKEKLPREISTSEWDKISEAYQEYVKSEG